MAERPDVTVRIAYRQGGETKTLTIEAGTDVLAVIRSAGTVRYATFERRLAKLVAAA